MKIRQIAPPVVLIGRINLPEQFFFCVFKKGDSKKRAKFFIEDIFINISRLSKTLQSLSTNYEKKYPIFRKLISQNGQDARLMIEMARMN